MFLLEWRVPLEKLWTRSLNEVIFVTIILKHLTEKMALQDIQQPKNQYVSYTYRSYYNHLL